MKNVVSSETAKALKEAGFPQPAPEFGQTWYTLRGVEVVIGGHWLGTEFYAMLCGGTNTVVVKRDIVFAPTATDLLRHLPTDIWQLTKGEKLWYIIFDTFERLLLAHELLAEVAAQAWLVENEKNKEQ